MAQFKYSRKSFSHNNRRNFKQIRAVLGQAGKRNEVAMNGLAKYCEQPDLTAENASLPRRNMLRATKQSGDHQSRDCGDGARHGHVRPAVANGFALPLTTAMYLKLGPPIFTQDIYYVFPNVGGHVLRA
jgi:hypothetical protein